MSDADHRLPFETVANEAEKSAAHLKSTSPPSNSDHDRSYRTWLLEKHTALLVLCRRVENEAAALLSQQQAAAWREQELQQKEDDLIELSHDLESKERFLATQEEDVKAKEEELNEGLNRLHESEMAVQLNLFHLTAAIENVKEITSTLNEGPARGGQMMGAIERGTIPQPSSPSAIRQSPLPFRSSGRIPSKHDITKSKENTTQLLRLNSNDRKRPRDCAEDEEPNEPKRICSERPTPKETWKAMADDLPNLSATLRPMWPRNTKISAREAFNVAVSVASRTPLLHQKLARMSLKWHCLELLAQLGTASHSIVSSGKGGKCGRHPGGCYQVLQTGASDQGLHWRFAGQ